MYCHANEPRAACPSVSDRKVFWLSLVGEFSSLDGTSVYSFVEHPRVYLGSRSHTGVLVSLRFGGPEVFAVTLMSGQGSVQQRPGKEEADLWGLGFADGNFIQQILATEGIHLPHCPFLC